MKTKFFHTLLALPGLLLLASCAAIDYYVDKDPESILEYSQSKIAESAVAKNVESASIRYRYTGSDGDANCVVDFKRPDKMRVAFFWNDEAEIYVLNGENSWQYENQKFSKLNSDNMDDLWLMACLMPCSVNYDEIADKFTLEEKTDFAGGDECYILSGVTQKTPHVNCKLWFSKQTKLLNRIQFITDAGIYDTTFMEYTEFADMQFAKFIYTEGPGVPSAKLELEEVEINQMKDDSVFERPVSLDTIMKAE